MIKQKTKSKFIGTSGNGCVLFPQGWRPLRRRDAPELSRLFRKAAARSYTRGRMHIVLTHALYQRINGDPQLRASPTLQTILRRVVRGEYDHLFN